MVQHWRIFLFQLTVHIDGFDANQLNIIICNSGLLNFIPFFVSNDSLHIVMTLYITNCHGPCAESSSDYNR